MTLIARLLTALVLAAALAPAPALAWWNGDWSYRMKVTADASATGANITQPIGRTQILLRLHSGNFDFKTAKDDGADLRVVAGDDHTPLRYGIEKFDGLVDQVGLIWVDISDLAPGNKTAFYLYWGNKNAPNASDSKATYDPDQVLVYHFAAENGLPRDATANGNDAQSGGKRDDGGMIGYGLRLDGHTTVRVPASASLATLANASGTWAIWAHPDNATETAILYQAGDTTNGLTIGLAAGVPYAEIDTAGAASRTPAGNPLPADSWHNIAVETDGTNLTLFVDGAARGQVAATLPALNVPSTLGGPATQAAAPAAPAPATPPVTPPATPPATPTTPGAAPPPPPDNLYAGLIDEFQIAKVARPAGAIQAAVASEGPNANLITYDRPEEASAFGSGYIGILARSLTPDALVVIAILAVMAAISWAVMVSKARFIGATAKANRAFRAEARRITRADTSEPFPVIDARKSPAIARSTLLGLYQVAVRELHDRLHDGRLDADGMLSSQSVAAIRASVDARLATESIRLNRLMVLLTIAISGGPFLGLLGTVVGVMITFAAIAAAGDVNVNAIAPGIAAALLATVAGLAVAIPALFGYNYFVTRIRDLTVDMTAFADELVARMAEGVRPRPPANDALAPPRAQAAE